MNVTSLIDQYCQAWTECDPVRRAELLVPLWAENATYTDPSAHVVGARALLDHIARMREKLPGVKLQRTSEVDLHHNVARFSWHAVPEDGGALPEGLDLAFVSEDHSRIERIIGFFGPLKREAG